MAPKMLRKLSARTLQVLTPGPKGMYGDHAAGCAHFVGPGGSAGCDPSGEPVRGCDVGEALHRVAFSDPKSPGALPRLQSWFTPSGRLINGGPR